MTGSAGQKRVPSDYFARSPFPLPPLAEQKRIVAKVDELMAVCDRLEAQQQERETLHAALARASLARFADAPTPANLPFLFHPSYAIAPADLRKSILTLAVQGKLVPQNPNDETAEDKIGRNEKMSFNAPFEIPEQWMWTQLSQLADINGGFAFKSTAYTDKGTRVVRISDFDEFGFKDHKVVRHPFSADLQKFTLEEQNILMAMTGGTVGKSYFVRSVQEPMVVNQRVATIKVSDSALPSYVDIVIRSEMTQEVIRKAKNSTNDNISMGDIKGFAIPTPPLAEQRRIVAKVEQLMALVDALETQLAASRATSANLLSAIVGELTRMPNTGKATVPSSSTSGRRGRPRKSP
jgi:type I restriction enzyme S subunit